MSMDMIRTNTAPPVGRVEIRPEPEPASAQAALLHYLEQHLRLLKSEAAHLERLLEVLRAG